MSTTAIILVLISAVLHVVWNLVMKRHQPTLAFYLVATVFGGLFLLPFYLWILSRLTAIPQELWWAMAATGLCQLIYIFGLVGAYRAGHLSVAYPILRSLPPVLVALAAIPIGRADRINLLCWLGIAGIVVGGAMLPMKSFGDLKLRNYWNRCCALSLVGAIGTAGYSLFDDYAVRVLRESPQISLSPLEAGLVYIPFQVCSVVIFLGAYVLVHTEERRQVVRILKKAKRTAAGVGICMYPAYALVLVAFAFTADPSYVIGFRQLSIPLSVLAGVFILSEPRSGPKFFGVALVFAGALLVAAG